MTSTFLSIQNATVRHLNQLIFNNLNLDIQEGEHWALVGESGSGKSALLSILAGKLAITGGEINRFFADEAIRAHQAIDPFTTFHQFIAMVDAKHHFRTRSNTTDFYYQQRYNSSDSDDALTVTEYLSTIKHTGSADANWTVDRVSGLLNLIYLADKQLIKLSNGETKRLMLAAALLKNPLLLLLDNPLTGLDVQTRQEFSKIIGQITDSGITVIMSTAADEIPDAITHVGILGHTRISGIPKHLFRPDLPGGTDDTAADTSAIQRLLSGYPPPKHQWIVKMAGVHVQYGEKIVLDDINWSIAPGERWALLGANGAGKSTLLSLINGDNPQAYANDLVLFDKKRGTGESIWDIKKQTGFISPEFYQYFPTDQNCLQVIESGFFDTVGLFRASDPKRAALCIEWMKVLEIDRYARMLLKNIPTGAQRLCLLARAMIKNPALLILDEPCQGMDAHQQHHFKTLVDNICLLCPVTLIYVTHYQEQIPSRVNHMLKLDHGRIIAQY